MAFLTLFIPTHNAPNAQAGQLLFTLTFAVGFALTLLVLLKPDVVKSERYGWVYMLSGNFCALTAILGETFTFGSQSSAMVILWPMVFAASFLSRRLLWMQVLVGTLCMVIMSYVKSRFVSYEGLWFVDVIVLAIPVAFTGLSISFFREAATQEAQELERMVGTDPLTGLSNRRELPKQFGELLLANAPTSHVAMMMLDLDHFKTINDRYGHQVGDAVLQHFAHMLKSHARPSDLVARLGGEEFMWITTAQELQELIYRVERLRESFSRSPEAKAVTVSVGLAYWSDLRDLNSEHLPELMRVADQALYRAKEEGRNRICVESIPAKGLHPEKIQDQEKIQVS